MIVHGKSPYSNIHLYVISIIFSYNVCLFAYSVAPSASFFSVVVTAMLKIHVFTCRYYQDCTQSDFLVQQELYVVTGQDAVWGGGGHFMTFNASLCIRIWETNAGISIPASITLSRYRSKKIKKMLDCVGLVRYRACSDIVSFFHPGTGLTGCRTVRHSGIYILYTVYTYTYTYAYAYTNIFTYTYMCTYKFICTFLYIPINIHIRIRIHLRNLRYVYVHIDI
jgi:hypothetical protein